MARRETQFRIKERGTNKSIVTPDPQCDDPKCDPQCLMQIAAIVGVATLNCDSGTLHGKRMVWGGRAQVLATLYMAAIVVTRYNPAIKTFYQRLCGVGKAKKVARAACMRKLLTMLKHRTRWRTDLPQYA